MCDHPKNFKVPEIVIKTYKVFRALLSTEKTATKCKGCHQVSAEAKGVTRLKSNTFLKHLFIHCCRKGVLNLIPYLHFAVSRKRFVKTLLAFVTRYQLW